MNRTGILSFGAGRPAAPTLAPTPAPAGPGRARPHPLAYPRVRSLASHLSRSTKPRIFHENRSHPVTPHAQPSPYHP